MISNIIYMILAFLAGIALGLFFFGGLWFTVKKSIASKIPAIWFFSSFIFRVGVVLICFYYISPGGWQYLVICLIGFIVARFVVTYITKSIDEKPIKGKAYHEA